jgi:hypothetical protein
MVGRGNIAFVNLLIRPLRLHGLELRKFALPLKRKSTLNGNLQATLILFTEVFKERIDVRLGSLFGF